MILQRNKFIQGLKGQHVNMMNTHGKKWLSKKSETLSLQIGDKTIKNLRKKYTFFL